MPLACWFGVAPKRTFLEGWFAAARKKSLRSRGRMRSPKQIRSLVNAIVLEFCREPVRIISAKGESFAIAQRDRHGVEAGNVIQPAARSQMNSPAVPPANANRLAFDNLRKPHSLADYANTKRGTESPPSIVILSL